MSITKTNNYAAYKRADDYYKRMTSWKTLKSQFNEIEFFSASDAAAVLDCSSEKASAILQDLVQTGNAGEAIRHIKLPTGELLEYIPSPKEYQLNYHGPLSQTEIRRIAVFNEGSNFNA